MEPRKRELEYLFGHEVVAMAIQNIDNELGTGYAENNPDLLEAYVEYLSRLQNRPTYMMPRQQIQP